MIAFLRKVAAYEPARLAETIRAVLILASTLGLLTAADVDPIVQAVIGLVGAVVLIVSLGLTIFTRNRVTPVDKLDGNHGTDLQPPAGGAA